MKKVLLNQFVSIVAGVMALIIHHHALAADAVPFGQDAGAYTLSFAEEFNSGFNTGIWNDHIWYETSNAAKNYAVEDGKLKIWPQQDAAGNFFNRTIDTDGRFSQAYGYFEIEAKLPMGTGTWPAFWLFNHIGDARPEIDIMEAYSGGSKEGGWSDGNQHPTAYAGTVWQDPAFPSGQRTILTPDLSAGFHKYGLKWEPGKMTFYFDGKEAYSVAASISDPLYILLDLWFGSASGTPDGTTPQGKGNAFEVNYVRAWKFR
jgi:beta-glucanase (GH16 family)